MRVFKTTLTQELLVQMLNANGVQIPEDGLIVEATIGFPSEITFTIATAKNNLAEKVFVNPVNRGLSETSKIPHSPEVSE